LTARECTSSTRTNSAPPALPLRPGLRVRRFHVRTALGKRRIFSNPLGEQRRFLTGR
jgi:hypothetical protein